ncbi:MAG: TonB-dependent receptor [Desulfobacterales bacterium]|nr:TonB-dependent receptor [Desulfobacterales bacterium]
MSINLKLKTFFALLTLLFCAIAFADDGRKLVAEMSLKDLLEIEVTVASKTKESVHDAPSSVTVFTRKEMLAMGIKSVEEVLNFVPGFQATREIVFGQGYVVSARGQSTPQASFNVLFMIDGQRINTDASGGALSVNHFIPIANVKQVEIIRGPGSALYGTNAYTGVINIVTETDTNDAFISRGNLDSNEYYANVSSKGEDYKLSLFGRHFDDKGQFYGREVTSLHKSSDNATYDPIKGDDAYISYTWKNKFRMNLRHTSRDIESFIITQSLHDVINESKPEQDFISLNYRLFNEDNEEKWEVSFYTSYMKSAETAIFDNTGLTDSIFVSQSNIEDEINFGIDGRYRLNDQNEFFTGLVWRQPNMLESRDKTHDLATGLVTNESSNMKEDDRQCLGVYFQNQYKFKELMKITLGVRHDNYSDFGGTTNPRGAVILSPGFKAKFKLMYGQAFRAPSMRQISAGGGLGNPDLDPETVKTFEAAWVQEISTFRTTLTYFNNKFKDKINSILVSGKRKFMNTTDLTTEGIEFEFFAQIIEGLTLRSAYTYLTKAEENPRCVAEQTFSTVGNYQYKNLNFNLNTYYHGKIEQAVLVNKQTSIIELDDYWVLNSAIRYNLNEQTTLVAMAKNLLDEEIFNSTKMAATLIEGLPARGRTFSFGIEVTF